MDGLITCFGFEKAVSDALLENSLIKIDFHWTLVAHTCYNPSHSGG
jgi:hypothetical protein